MTHEQDWHDLLPRIRARWPQLTEAELEPTRGERGALVALLHRLVGGDEQALSREIDLLLADEPQATPDAGMAEEYAKGEQASERIDEGPVLADAGSERSSTAAQQAEGGDQRSDAERDEARRRAG